MAHQGWDRCDQRTCEPPKPLRGSEGENSEVGVICESITPVTNGLNGSGNGNGNGSSRSLNIRVGGIDREQLKALRALLGMNPGESPVYFHLPSNGAITKLCVEVKVDPSPKLLSDIEHFLGKDAIWIE